MKSYPITPVPKPRMTQRDKWAKRPPVMRYRAFADDCRLHGVEVPLCDYHVTFYLPMPKSWTKAKREKMNGQPHQQRPDKDNLEKALLDAVMTEDCAVWDGRATKRWAYTGHITIKTTGATQ